MASEKTLALLRSRLCNPNFVHSAFKSSPDSNYSKLKFLISNSISEACNNSVLLLGPRGCGKSAVVDLVLEDLRAEHPDMISVVRLNGLLHSDDNCGLKEIARQLCLEHQLLFSKMASSDDNSQFMMDMLRECGLAHKSVIFVLDEFDLFTQGKQRLLYSLLDALQTLTCQAVVIGVSCRLRSGMTISNYLQPFLKHYIPWPALSRSRSIEDADQLLEKRVRSRFSHRKLLFVPPTTEDTVRLLEHLLYLPKDQSFPSNYITEFNSTLQKILGDKRFKEILSSLSNVDGTVSDLLRFLFRVVSYIDPESGLLSLENFKAALLCTQRQPKLENLHDVSILELYMLVCMNRLEIKEQNSYNFSSIMKEYKSIQNAYKTSDNYARGVCLRAFEHLLERELISFSDPRARSQSIEFRPVKLLLSPRELHQGLKSNSSCPTSGTNAIQNPTLLLSKQRSIQ